MWYLYQPGERRKDDSPLEWHEIDKDEDMHYIVERINAKSLIICSTNQSFNEIILLLKNEGIRKLRYEKNVL